MGSGLELSHDLDNSGKIGFSFLEQLHESSSGKGPAGKSQGDLCPLGNTQMTPSLLFAVFVQNPKTLWMPGPCPR